MSAEEKNKKEGIFCRTVFASCFVISAGLMIWGFFAPPTGVIDGSVLTAVGELAIFPAMAYGYRAITLGLGFKYQRGDTVVEVHKDNDEDKED